MPRLSLQLLQQCLGLLQVGGVKALGEPAVDRRQQLAGFGPLALLLPQASSGSWRPAAPATSPAGGGRRRGPAGNRLPPPPAASAGCRSSKLAPEPIQLRFPAALLHAAPPARQRLGQRLQPFFRAGPAAPEASASRAQIIWDEPALPPWPARRPAPGASGPSPPRPGPASASAQPRRIVPMRHPECETPARSRARRRPLPARGTAGTSRRN